jgi:hypothetical protein
MLSDPPSISLCRVEESSDRSSERQQYVRGDQVTNQIEENISPWCALSGMDRV